MIKPLLVEITVEELPAIPFLKELPNIEKKWADILEANNLLCEFNFYYTPRRLVFWHREFKVAQDDTVVEQLGAPVSIAYKDGEPTGAAIGFAKKCGVDISELSSIDKGRGEVLYFKQEVKGKESKELLNDMVNEFIKSLNFGKSMKWGSRKDSFIRPIRGLSIVLGDDLVDGELYGMKSSKSSFAHRMVSYDKFDFDFAGDYFCKLGKNGVVLYQDERRKLILDQMKKIESENSFEIIIDEDLLDEVVAITEYPTALVGNFDEEFLELPTEVIIGSMKEHQRYFEVFENGQITNKFIVVSNSYTKDFTEIIAGNEKVLRPRLADGMFFYKNDLKNGLNNEGLKKITFVEGMGSLHEKIQREAKLAQELAKSFDMTNEDIILLEKAVMMSKSDLLTDMVYEFTDLQGLMGYYYAKAAGEDEKVYTAIKEQYLPDGEDSDLPSSKFSAIVALSNKLDTIKALFSVGMIPTGSRDPFALRRAAAGIVKICIEHKLNLDIKTLVSSDIVEFFNERLFKIYSHINPSVIKAVLSTGEGDILEIDSKLNALNPIVQSSDFKEYSATFKRVANIIKDLDTSSTLAIDESLFEDEAEKQLYISYKNVISKEYVTYDEQLEALFGLKPQLDKFFEEVFVNHENEVIKTNRKNTIGNVYQAFKTIADIKEITI
ncbi:MAG: glycine--tRNA ligase subunit beta [Campylobacteraceae bacterium]|jgi:glycyl-tRNA synthetase beta chain|nr:glycine--tRNA ligase subunit beta [Campylobacteraceae bacterium]MBT3882104.1 glycine--tRNA ligase subunit beta [Campylobacteraceae bacterium]MBT4030115.1 glycine--tRNA ligase subunit beta [Campylobacteraceae bacterium]MBT4178811.1 glycine--tRNA ligase subunit beta [Campylobacteraceae bacterium]MBT4572040.1 glycine--tRNA ligase subunit beta [Campylobacteraceae bacterium]